MTTLVKAKYLPVGFVVGCLSIIAWASTASAQNTARQAQERACSRDVSRHCRKVMNDGDAAVHQCLLQKLEKLSPACRNMVERGR